MGYRAPTAAFIKSGSTQLTKSIYSAGFDGPLKAARASAEAVEDQRQGVQVTLLAEVARGYISLRTLQARLAIANQKPRRPDAHAGHPCKRGLKMAWPQISIWSAQCPGECN